MEEERRLFYVGATRAMDQLYLTSCAYRRVFGQTTPMAPSLFLEEADGSKLRIVGTPPYGFMPRGLRGAAGLAGKGGESSAAGHGAKRAVSSDGRWQVGDRVFNEDRGYGEIIAVAEGDEGPVITAQYENGRRQRFLSRAQSSRFMKIND
jgi:DNA helicase-2/ATP-dependent DNA helicase PcrA